MSGVGVLLCLALVCLSASVDAQAVILPTPSRGFCGSHDLNLTGNSIADYIEENQDRLSDCCWANSHSRCQARGGFCIPAWLGHYCRSSDPSLCGYCGCTCCLPQACDGGCSYLGQKGICRSTCNSYEHSVPGGCSSGNCVCCVRKVMACAGFCPRFEICMPATECFLYAGVDTDEPYAIEPNSCGSPGCTCCPSLIGLPWK